jgi:hypothetical protein
MASDGGGRAYPEARFVAGHLIALVADRDYAALSAELSPLVQSPGSSLPGPALYGDVLTWVVTALADVVVARLGAAADGESFVLEVRTTAGRTVGAGDLPPGQGRVGRSVLALLPTIAPPPVRSSQRPNANPIQRCGPPLWSRP